MKILIIRHADPDYEKDSLTEKGWKEAELLTKKLIKLPISKAYVSPLGRAQDTAASTLEHLKLQAEVKDWLREFPVEINRPDRTDQKIIAWDWLPQDWTKDEDYFRRDLWGHTEIMKEGHVYDQYLYVINEFDKILAQHGYQRDGDTYRVTHPNTDTIAFFCHFGLECVLLSHLMNVSPMILWHHTCAAPSSVTKLTSEERRKGIAVFRMSSFGDISHLYAGDEEPSFAARFCETYDNMNERHD